MENEKPRRNESRSQACRFFGKAGRHFDTGRRLRRGKTTFTKGFAEGLGITRVVNSPTFTIIKEYHDGSLPLYHMDVYRMEDESEDLGLEEYFEDKASA